MQYYNGEACWQIIREMTEELKGEEAFNIGNVIKYLYRYKRKEAPLNDLKKARDYLQRVIDSYNE